MMNSSIHLMFVAFLSIAIGNGTAGYLDFWYTGQDLNCMIYSNRTNERPFEILVIPSPSAGDTWCPKSSQYYKIPIIRELIDFKGDLQCLERKNKFEVLECKGPLGNCKINAWIYNTTTNVNKTVLIVSLQI